MALKEQKGKKKSGDLLGEISQPQLNDTGGDFPTLWLPISSLRCSLKKRRYSTVSFVSSVEMPPNSLGAFPLGYSVIHETCKMLLLTCWPMILIQKCPYDVSWTL